ncbi:hypothetical protein ACFJIX_22140 [Roseateles sp. UC29_93]|uniref:hypothetical protein n=1 Tax=Roseateles sp. UC29_93 TaxID=3350177 RepID=UPI00366B5804
MSASDRLIIGPAPRSVSASMTDTAYGASSSRRSATLPDTTTVGSACAFDACAFGARAFDACAFGAGAGACWAKAGPPSSPRAALAQAVYRIVFIILPGMPVYRISNRQLPEQAGCQVLFVARRFAEPPVVG